ncbi:MAG: glycoside hydrolase family 13 protein [Actinobacteria bacterium]|nr:glycoside hydrolase family 13 protein [Actinomycetota bacterium]
MKKLAFVFLLAVCVLPAQAEAANARLFHDTFDVRYRSPGGAVATGGSVRLRLRVIGARPKSVTLRVDRGDPAADTQLRSFLPLHRAGNFWSVTLGAPAKPAILTYAFRVRVGSRTLWYGDDFGAADDDVHQGGTGVQSALAAQGFQLTVYGARFTTPSWLQGAVVYSIFPDRFRNGDLASDYCRAGSTSGCPSFYASIQAQIHQTWNERMEDPHSTGVFNRDFFGGDLEGIQEKLGYLKALGVDAIWMTPIFKARSNHRYDTEDYHHVDAGLGGDPAFASLATAAKAQGIRLLLDGVFNHASSDSLYFDRYHRYASVGACESPDSPWRSWFRFTTNTTPCGSDDYVGWASLDTLPVFEHGSAAVRDFFYRGSDSVVRHWSERGADGWRLDAADQLNHAWWRDFRSAVKSYAPDSAVVGEIWPDASEYLLGNELDSVMNYRFRRAVDGFVRATDWSDPTGRIPTRTPTQLDRSLQAVREDYPPQASAAAFNLLDSHDTNRALFVFTEPGDDGLTQARDRLRLAALLQFTYVGAPMIYYGDEAAINAPGIGVADPFNRAPYPWADASGDPSTYGPADTSMIAFYTKLSRIRHELLALRTGTFDKVLASDATGIYAFTRAGGGAKPVVVALNKSGSPRDVVLRIGRFYPDGTVLEDRITGTTSTVGGGTVRVSLAARSGAILAAR